MSAEFGLDFTGKVSYVYSSDHYFAKAGRSPREQKRYRTAKKVAKNCRQELTKVSSMQHDGKSQR
jgi:hypothetical protein